MNETKEQQDCIYCHKPYKPLLNFKIKDGDSFLFEPNIESFDGHGTAMEQVKTLHPYGSLREFKYCPMRGRKLVHDEN